MRRTSSVWPRLRRPNGLFPPTYTLMLDAVQIEILGLFVLLAVIVASLTTALREAHQRAEAAVRVRDDFLARVSHDLKNPLTSIKGRAELLHHRKIGRVSPSEGAWLVDGLDYIRVPLGEAHAPALEIADARN